MSTLTKLGLQPVNEESCFFISKELIVFFYIDDIVVLFRKKHKKTFKEFKEKLMDHYEIREIGELNWFLAI